MAQAGKDHSHWVQPALYLPFLFAARLHGQLFGLGRLAYWCWPFLWHLCQSFWHGSPLRTPEARPTVPLMPTKLWLHILKALKRAHSLLHLLSRRAATGQNANIVGGPSLIANVVFSLVVVPG